MSSIIKINNPDSPQTQRQTSEYPWCELCHVVSQYWHASVALTGMLKNKGFLEKTA